MKKFIAYGTLTIIMATISYLFYHQEIQYWLPTPVPGDYQAVPFGTEVNLKFLQKGRKKFIHFYNPNCPCSRFNLQSYKSLLRNYHQDFDCYAIVQNTVEGVSGSNVDFLKELDVQLIADQDKKIAKQCGVYATPQIVLLDENNQVYFRGNYNKSRYCTQPATNYAKIAIDSMLSESYFVFPTSALKAYGCDLEKHTH